MQIVIAILAFCVIIIIHELGHFTAAKLCGIQVNEFAVGMGPVILRKKGRETNYVIRLLPGRQTKCATVLICSLMGIFFFSGTVTASFVLAKQKI